MELERKCAWKIVSENDDRKRKSGRGCVTLSEDKPCYSCDGFNRKCGAYHAKRNVGREVVSGKV